MNIKLWLAAALFGGFAIYLSTLVPTIEAAWVMAVLVLTVYLFVFEVVDVDVVAITIMVLLGLSTLAYPFMGLEKGLVPANRLFDGFASNAVISIIAVMIIGAGLDKTGIMGRVASFILRIGGKSEVRIVPVISTTVGIISSFMQNVGATALFLPVVSRISARTGLPMSRLLMPMGFCAILGGTMTMVGSSPLILLNDLIITSNSALPAGQKMEAWSLFSVTPIGAALIATGIAYFLIAGRFVLPSKQVEGATGEDTMHYFKEIYGMQWSLREVTVPEGSHLIGLELGRLEKQADVMVIAVQKPGGETIIGQGTFSRDVTIEAETVLGLMASPGKCRALVNQHELEFCSRPAVLADALSSSKAGIAELVIPPSSKLIGKSEHELWMRRTYGLSIVALHRLGKTYRKDDVRDMPLQAGDTLIAHTPWAALAKLEKDRNFVVVTSEYPKEETRPHKVYWALTFFALALCLILFTELRLSIALLAGAIGMVLSGVLSIEEAYEAVSWKTVFLLASLIPLGIAVQDSKTAEWIAQQTLVLFEGLPIWSIQAAIAILATLFSLVMSNVGATVLLVPLAVSIAVGAGGDPAVFALTVAIATSNSFLIPTHQVNALIMGPGNYRVSDFLRAGGIMTVLFLVVSLAVLNLMY